MIVNNNTKYEVFQVYQKLHKQGFNVEKQMVKLQLLQYLFFIIKMVVQYGQ